MNPSRKPRIGRLYLISIEAENPQMLF
jgi:hypothetical protein